MKDNINKDDNLDDLNNYINERNKKNKIKIIIALIVLVFIAVFLVVLEKKYNLFSQINIKQVHDEVLDKALN